jgi:hypothetical protein
MPFSGAGEVRASSSLAGGDAKRFCAEGREALDRTPRASHGSAEGSNMMIANEDVQDDGGKVVLLEKGAMRLQATRDTSVGLRRRNSCGQRLMFCNQCSLYGSC